MPSTRVPTTGKPAAMASSTTIGRKRVIASSRISIPLRGRNKATTPIVSGSPGAYERRSRASTGTPFGTWLMRAAAMPRASRCRSRLLDTAISRDAPRRLHFSMALLRRLRSPLSVSRSDGL
jgi:hypothetical protein